MKSTIYLVRHGITEGYKKAWYYGGTDMPLTEDGVEGIKKLAEEGIYPDPSDAQIFTSGMLRAEQTLFNMYGREIEHEVITDFREQHYGILECLLHEDVIKLPEGILYLEDKTDTYVLPGGGESRQGFYDRVEASWEELVKLHRLKELSHRHSQLPASTILVCHGGTIDRIIKKVFGNGDEPRFKWTPEPGHGFAVEFENGEPVSYEGF